MNIGKGWTPVMYQDTYSTICRLNTPQEPASQNSLLWQYIAFKNIVLDVPSFHMALFICDNAILNLYFSL